MADKKDKDGKTELTGTFHANAKKDPFDAQVDRETARILKAQQQFDAGKITGKEFAEIMRDGAYNPDTGKTYHRPHHHHHQHGHSHQEAIAEHSTHNKGKKKHTTTAQNQGHTPPRA